VFGPECPGDSRRESSSNCNSRTRDLSLRLEIRAAELPAHKTVKVSEPLLMLLLPDANTGVTTCIIDPQQDRFAATVSCL